MKERKELIKKLKEDLKKQLKREKTSWILSEAASLACIVMQILAVIGIVPFVNIGALIPLVCVVGSFSYLSCYSVNNEKELGKYGEHLDNIKANGVKNSNELNRSRMNRIKKYKKILEKKNKSCKAHDIFQMVMPVLSFAAALALPLSTALLAFPIASLVDLLFARSTIAEAAELNARIKCIEADLKVAKLMPTATSTGDMKTNEKEKAQDGPKEYTYAKSYGGESAPVTYHEQPYQTTPKTYAKKYFR